MAKEKTNMSAPKQLTLLVGLRAFIAFSSAIVFCPGGHAAEMRLLLRGNDYRSLILEGEIESGDYEHFLRAVKDNQGELADVYLLSRSGDFVEAIKIGRALRAQEMRSVVPGRNSAAQSFCYDDSIPRNPANCTAASAAFFIHVGAVERAGLYLVVHRPYFAPEQFAKFPESQVQAAFDALQRDARAYMTEMGVPPQVQEQASLSPFKDFTSLFCENLQRWEDSGAGNCRKTTLCETPSLPGSELCVKI
jgi:hypothetical protein